MDLSTFLAALDTRASTALRRSVRATTPRAPSKAARFLADLRTFATDQGKLGIELPCSMLIREWCATNEPARDGALTPWATIEAQLAVAAVANALPSDVRLIDAKAARAAGKPFMRLIVIDAPAVAAQRDTTHGETTDPETVAEAVNALADGGNHVAQAIRGRTGRRNQ